MAEPPPLDPNVLQDALLPPIQLAADRMTGAFLIDPDRAEQFITEVRGAADRLDRAKSAARQARWVEPVDGGDPVTNNAAVQAQNMADNAWKALDSYQLQLLATADQLQQQLAAYRATEQANTAGRT